MSADEHITQRNSSVSGNDTKGSTEYQTGGIHDFKTQPNESCSFTTLKSNTDEEAAIPLMVGDVHLAEAQELWSTVRDKAVKLRMDRSGLGSQPPMTVHQMFMATVQKFGEYPALRVKKDRTWVTLTYNEYYQHSRAAAKSFMKLGLERFHSVGILGFNSPEWFIADVGCILAGGLSTGIYTTNSPEACQYVADDCKANVLVVENNKQLTKILQITWTASAAGHMIKLKMAEEEVVSYLPLSHVAAQINDMWISMRIAGVTSFAEPDALKGSLGNTLREVRPTRFLGVPRVWEKMQEAMKAVGKNSSVMKRIISDWAKVIGLQASYNTMNGVSSAPWGFTLANILVFNNVRKALGLDRCRACYTGAAPITKDTLEYFMSLYIPIFELYGMSESTGPHTMSWAEGHRIMSCGKVLNGCKTKIDKPDADGNGEICFWGRHVFMGYLNMPEKTENALDADAWLHSGDLGKHDKDDFLFITGRIKELIITAGGENVPPIPIENALKEKVSIISNVMLVGDKKKFLSMLVTLKCNADDNGDPTDDLTPQVVEFCQQCGVVASKVSEVINKKEPAIYKAIQEGIDHVNAKATSNVQRVQKWTILPQDFSISGGELGPTMKLKRPVVNKMYQEEINKFYSE
ncbi:long-chain-fatty-acid--CoA ligase ACSBG2-like isoform X2 [Danio aesculapii]|uniref:long-chain-fatty-acid--CoA ligase ACSBG2-like isoform X2 n=1 Tax=Danio aesculapii TaxID=1142201 RepID=UPI0024BF6985|nr:long-chain-fatty-acid--CoA ligase ACSBG2-like isoform X2 [Danio aesculapii]